MDSNNYDDSDPKSIVEYSKKLINKTFAQVIAEDQCNIKEGEWNNRRAELFEKVKNIWSTENNKGKLGQIIEKYFYHIEPNTRQEPDFPKANLELKTTPYKSLKKGDVSAKERLEITKINYDALPQETFETSSFWKKAKSILLLYYKFIENIDNKLNYPIHYSYHFHPPDEDLATLKHDFEIIKKKVMDGKAHELSCSDTTYLEASPKAANSSDRTTQPYSDELAKPRAFSFKSGYMTSILRRYIVPGITAGVEGTILSKDNKIPLEEFIVNRVKQYSGKTMNELKREFDVKTNPKNLGSYLVFKILNVKGNQAEEFQKANIAVKVIRIEKNGKIKEHMSFPIFKFKEIVEEKWEESTFGNYLRDTRFFFVVYRKNEENEYVLKGGQFWNIPFNDLENQVHSVWNKTVVVINDGSSFTINNGKHKSDLPKTSENKVCHVRPHGRNSKDTYDLPNGKPYPKQCFWLHKEYIKDQLNKEFFE